MGIPTVTDRLISPPGQRREVASDTCLANPSHSDCLCVSGSRASAAAIRACADSNWFAHRVPRFDSPWSCAFGIPWRAAPTLPPLVRRPRVAYNPLTPPLKRRFSPTAFIHRDDPSPASHLRLAANERFSLGSNKPASRGRGRKLVCVRCREPPMKSSQIVSDPETMGGTPVFVGTRVPVRILFEHLEAGDPLEVFLEDFPSVSRAAAIQVLQDAKAALVEDAHPA